MTPVRAGVFKQKHNCVIISLAGVTSSNYQFKGHRAQKIRKFS